MWYEFLDNMHDISSMYNSIPPLNNVRLMEIAIYQDQKIIIVRFDLPAFADKYPDQWKEYGYNTVQLQVELSDLQSFNLSGWEGEIIVDMAISKLSTNSISLVILSPQCLVQITALKSRIASIRGYKNNEDSKENV